MSRSLPLVSWKDIAKVLQKAGFELDHQHGSHLVFRRVQTPHRRVAVPRHKEIGRGLLRKIIWDAGLTVEEFLDLVE